MPAFESVERVFTRVNTALSYLCAFFVVFMTVSIIYDIFARLLFKAPTIWVIDINEYLLVYLTFVPAAWILMRDRHVKVELLTTRLLRRTRLRLGIVTDIFACLYCIILAWQGWVVAWEALQRGYEFSTALAFPRFPVLVIIPAGAASLALTFVVKIWSHAHLQSTMGR
jgi:TRAP-type C4-dicarboxylate transport system permease small subunit